MPVQEEFYARTSWQNNGDAHVISKSGRILVRRSGGNGEKVSRALPPDQLSALGRLKTQVPATPFAHPAGLVQIQAKFLEIGKEEP